MPTGDDEAPRQESASARRERLGASARLLPAVAPLSAALVLAAYGLAAWRAERGVRELEWLKDLPLAEPAATSSPARHVGKLRGPEGRSTPAGDRAAVYWWTVVYRGGEDESDRVYCKARERSGLTLETPHGPLRLPFMEADPDEVGLVTSEKRNEFDRRIVIDLGDQTRMITAALPAGTCTGDGARYEQLHIPDGADVEVVGCAEGGALVACNTPLAGALATPDLSTYRRHRRGDVADWFRYALAFSMALLVVAGIWTAWLASQLPLHAPEDP